MEVGADDFVGFEPFDCAVTVTTSQKCRPVRSEHAGESAVR